MTKRIKAFFRKKGADKPIFFAVFVLICLGIVMIGSASIGAVSSKGTAFAIKNMITQSIYVAIGVFIMMVLTKGFKLKMINYRSSMAVYIMDDQRFTCLDSFRSFYSTASRIYENWYGSYFILYAY